MKNILLSLFAILSTINLIAQEKCLLPHVITSRDKIVTFTYDEQNRFKKIKIEQNGEQSIVEFIYNYKGTDSSYEIKRLETSVKMDILEKSKSKVITKQIVDKWNNDIGKITELELNSLGRVTKEVIKTIDKRTYSIKFKYDKKNNVSKVSLNNNENLKNIFSFLNNKQIIYDNKNGIFKNLNIKPLEVIYSESENIVPYFLFLSNNIAKVGNDQTMDYTYNEDGYPTTVKSNIYYIPDILISYIEVAPKVRFEVTYEDLEPMIGATIIVAGTNIGTCTDFDGIAYLENLSEPCKITISYIGFKSKTIEYKGKSFVKIKMELDPYVL